MDLSQSFIVPVILTAVCLTNGQQEVLYYISDSVIFYCNHFNPTVEGSLKWLQCDEVEWQITVQSSSYATFFKSKYYKSNNSEVYLKLEEDKTGLRDDVTATTFLQADPFKPCAHAIELSNLGKRDMEGRKMKCDIYMAGTNSNGSRVRTKGGEDSISITKQTKWLTSMGLRVGAEDYKVDKLPNSVNTKEGERVAFASVDDWFSDRDGIDYISSNITVMRGLEEYVTNTKGARGNFLNVHFIEEEDHLVKWRCRSTVNGGENKPFIVAYSRTVITDLTYIPPTEPPNNSTVLLSIGIVLGILLILIAVAANYYVWRFYIFNLDSRPPSLYEGKSIYNYHVVHGGVSPRSSRHQGSSGITPIG